MVIPIVDFKVFYFQTLFRDGSHGSEEAWRIHNQEVAGSNQVGGDMFSDQKHILRGRGQLDCGRRILKCERRDEMYKIEIILFSISILFVYNSYSIDSK